MSAWPLLLGAVAAAAGATGLGWPAWTAYQARRRRDLNAERYLAWRGRADHQPAEVGLTAAERRRLWSAALLALAALACVAAFLSYR